MIPNVGEVEMLARVLNKSTQDDCVLHLFTNNITPGETDTVSTYTEVSGLGYTTKQLTGDNWTIATYSGESIASFPQQTFTFTGAVTVYGYYVTNHDGSILLFSELFSDGPYAIGSSGGTINITVKLKLD